MCAVVTAEGNYCIIIEGLHLKSYSRSNLGYCVFMAVGAVFHLTLVTSCSALKLVYFSMSSFNTSTTDHMKLLVLLGPLTQETCFH